MDDIRRLVIVAEALNRAGVRWWVDHGTLLGIVRDTRLLPWDRDIDLSLMSHDLDRAYVALRSVGPLLGAWVVRTRRNIKLLPRARGQRAIDLGAYRAGSTGDLEKLLVMFPRGKVRRGSALLQFGWRRARAAEGLLDRTDRWLLGRGPRWTAGRRFVDKLYRQVTVGREALGVLHASRVPDSYFVRLDTISWRGLLLPAPAQAEDYLAYRYGNDWRVPQRQWKWWNDDHTLDR